MNKAVGSQREMNRDLAIRELRAEEANAARELILAGLEEHWGRLDPALNPDLEDILHAYQGGIFLAAWLGEELAGTGALMPLDDGVSGQIVRMSVKKSARRAGIGRAVLAALEERARQMGMRRLVLETTETWQDAVAFYRSAGFRETHRLDGDVYFEREIG